MSLAVAIAGFALANQHTTVVRGERTGPRRQWRNETEGSGKALAMRCSYEQVTARAHSEAGAGTALQRMADPASISREGRLSNAHVIAMREHNSRAMPLFVGMDPLRQFSTEVRRRSR